MVSRIHRVVQHRSTVPGIEPMTLVSNHHFPRHSHDPFSIGVIAFGAQRSSSAVGQVSASAGDVIMANPGEMHDGIPWDNNARQWRMIYIGPALLARELKEETARPVEIVHPVAQDLLLAHHFARLFACLTAARSERLARDERLLLPLIRIVRWHGMVRPSAVGPSCERNPSAWTLLPGQRGQYGQRRRCLWSAASSCFEASPTKWEPHRMPTSRNGACAWRDSFWPRVRPRPSANVGRLRRPESYDPRPRPPNRRNAEPLSSCHSLIGAGHAQFRSRHGRPIVRCLASGGRDPRTLRVNKAGLLATPLVGAKRLNKRRQP